MSLVNLFSQIQPARFPDTFPTPYAMKATKLIEHRHRSSDSLSGSAKGDVSSIPIMLGPPTLLRAGLASTTLALLEYSVLVIDLAEGVRLGPAGGSSKGDTSATSRLSRGEIGDTGLNRTGGGAASEDTADLTDTERLVA